MVRSGLIETTPNTAATNFLFADELVLQGTAYNRVRVRLNG